MVQNFVNNLLRRNPRPEDIQITPIRFDVNGNYDPVASANAELNLKQKITPLTLGDRFFGREMTQDYQKFNPETNQVEMATLTNRKPGLINDFMGGLRENYNEGLQAENLMPNQNKGWATRLGEGFGTALRFADKPIGRFALASGLSALTGEANPLAEGVTAYVGRQGNVARNRIYGKSLKDMGYTDDQLAGINLTDDIYKNLSLNAYRQNMNNYRNLKLDKDTYVKEYKNISDLLDRGLITAEQATQQMMFLNQEYNRQNNIELQTGNKTKLVDVAQQNADTNKERVNVSKSLGNRRLDIAQQNADTYKQKGGKTKIEETPEYKQDFADYVTVMTNPKYAKYRSEAQTKFAGKYGKLPKVN